MRQTLRGLQHVLVITLVLLLVPVASASAFVRTGQRWDSPNISFFTSISYNQTGTGWTKAADAWNYSLTDIRYVSGNSTRLTDTNNFSVSWDGNATWNYNTSTSRIFSAVGTLNYVYIKNYSAATIQGVAVHELGHIAGLAHGGGCVIMVDNTNSRNGCGIYVPQPDDKNGINAIS